MGLHLVHLALSWLVATYHKQLLATVLRSHTALNTHPNHDNVILEGTRFDMEAPFQRRLRSQSDIHPIPISEEVAPRGLNRATRGLSSLCLKV